MGVQAVVSGRLRFSFSIHEIPAHQGVRHLNGSMFSSTRQSAAAKNEGLAKEALTQEDRIYESLI